MPTIVPCTPAGHCGRSLNHSCFAHAAAKLCPAPLQDTVIEENVVTDRGAGFAIETADMAVFVNATFRKNVSRQAAVCLFSAAPCC